MTERLIPGDPAPAFTLKNSVGQDVSLGDFLGRSTVVYFYPAASTPGCTKQACDFRDSLASLQHAGYEVVGISPDPVDKLARFAAEEGLDFPLLSDPDHTVADHVGIQQRVVPAEDRVTRIGGQVTDRLAMIGYEPVDERQEVIAVGG